MLRNNSEIEELMKFDEDIEPQDQQCCNDDLFQIHYPPTKSMKLSNNKSHYQSNKNNLFSRSSGKLRGTSQTQSKAKVNSSQKACSLIPENLSDIEKNCIEIKQKIMKEKFEQFADLINQLFPIHFSPLLSRDTLIYEEDHKVMETFKLNKQIKKKSIKKSLRKKKTRKQQQSSSYPPQQKKFKTLIIPLVVKNNQQKCIKPCLSYFYQFLKKTYEDNVNVISKNREQVINKKRKNLVVKAHKINLIVNEQSTSITKIALDLYIKSERVHVRNRLQNQLTIYCAHKITNLNPENIHKFQILLERYNCVLILPTLHPFHSSNYEMEYQIVNPIDFFNHKLLFCQFFFECLTNDQIKAYLPKQSLSLIDQFDNFPITYHEGCRRLIYIIKKMHVEAHSQKIKLESFNINILFDVLFKCFEKRLTWFGFGFKKEHYYEKIVRAILDEDYSFAISEDFQAIKRFYDTTDMQDRDSQQLAQKFRERIKARFGYEKELQQYQYMLDGDLKKFRTYQSYEKYLSSNQKQQMISQKQNPQTVALCKGAPYNGTPCNRVPRKGASRNATPHKATPQKATPQIATPRKGASRNATPHKATPQKATPQKATPHKVRPLKLTPQKKTGQRISIQKQKVQSKEQKKIFNKMATRSGRTYKNRIARQLLYAEQDSQLSEQVYDSLSDSDKYSQQLAVSAKKQKKQRFLNQKALLDYQLNHIIKKYTRDIRRYSRNGCKRISWEHLQYQKRIKPQIPWLIYSAAMKFNNLYRQIQRNSPFHLSEIINICPINLKQGADNSLEYGKLWYQLKELQLYGLISIKKKNFYDPLIVCQFYKKSTYHKRLPFETL